MYISTEWTLPLCCRSCCILVPITIYTASSISFVQVDLALTRSSRSCWPWLPNRQYCLPVHCRSWGSISRSGQGKPYPCPLQHQASRGMTLCGMRLQLQPASWQRQGRMGYRASSASYWTAPHPARASSFMMSAQHHLVWQRLEARRGHELARQACVPAHHRGDH